MPPVQPAPTTRFAAPALSRQLATLAAAVLLAACSTRPVAPDRDGPGANPPPNLQAVPDADPRIEPLRAGGPNKPYEVLGQVYTPLAADLPLRENGGASWYGRKFHGKPTATGEPYDMYAMTAAHKTMPLPSYARVRNPSNGREVVVRVNDRGPFASGRVIDLSYTAALKLGLLGGVAPVEVQRLTHDDIRSGRWRGAAPAEAVATAPAAGSAPAAAATPAPALALAPAPLVAGGTASAAARVEPATLLPPDDPAPGDAQPVWSAPVQTTAPVASQPRGWWLQFGAFRVRESALALQQRLQAAVLGEPGAGEAGATTAQVLAVFDDAGLFRVQAGPWPTRTQAQAAAERLRQPLGGAPIVMERR
jgi:rare lipoprotein A